MRASCAPYLSKFLIDIGVFVKTSQEQILDSSTTEFMLFYLPEFFVTNYGQKKYFLKLFKIIMRNYYFDTFKIFFKNKIFVILKFRKTPTLTWEMRLKLHDPNYSN